MPMSKLKSSTKLNLLLVICIPTFIAVVFGWLMVSSAVSDHARTAAIEALRNWSGKHLNKGTVVIVDFTKPSQLKRLAVMNIENETVLFSARVAHGKNSGLVYASELSNDIGSLKSSAGLFEITESFKGKKGLSLRLKGLDPHLNGNAEIRGIIIHSANYVSLYSIIANWKERFRLGRSEGCFVLSRTDFQKLIENLARPAYLYAYHNSEVAHAAQTLAPRVSPSN